MAPVLLNSAGVPEPSSEVQRRLRAIHPRLSLKYVVVAPSSWAVTLEWAENDERRERVRTGRLDPASAYDIIGYLPMDAAVEEAPAYLSRMFREYPLDHVRNIADHVENFNATAPVQAAVEAAAAAVLDNANPTAAPKRRGRK